MRHGTGERPVQPGAIIDLEGMPDGVCNVTLGSRTYQFGVDFSIEDLHHVTITVEGKLLGFTKNARNEIHVTSFSNVKVHDALFDAARRVARTIFELSPDEKIRLAPQPPKTRGGQDGYARFQQGKQTPRAANKQQF